VRWADLPLSGAPYCSSKLEYFSVASRDSGRYLLRGQFGFLTAVMQGRMPPN
jgi:hypothetical protein